MHLSRIRDVKELAVLSDEARDVKEEVILESSGHQVRTPENTKPQKLKRKTKRSKRTSTEKQIEKSVITRGKKKRASGQIPLCWTG